MSALAPRRMTVQERVRGAFRVLAGLFLPQHEPPPVRSLFEGDPDQIRKERPLRSVSTTRWFQSDVESAIHLADTGDLSVAARLARSMRRDGALSGILATRAGGLTRLPKVFRGTPDVLADLERKEGLGLFDRIFPPKELELLNADGIVLGVGVGELLPIPGRAEPMFVRLEPEFLRYRWSEDRWYYQSIAGQIPIEPGDGRWILHCPGGYQAPWSNGLWPSLARAFIAKEHAYLHRENYSGKLANPARVAVSPAGAAEREKRSFFERVMAWGVNTVFGLPPGWDVKLIESSGRGYEVFQETIDSSDREYMIGVAGQIVTVTGGAGFANADIHATIRSDLIQGDGDGLSSTISLQGLSPIVNRLYGGAASALAKWDTRPPADLKAEGEAISAAARAIDDANRALAPYGLKIDAREIATRFKIPTVATQQDSAPSAAVAAPSAPASGVSEIEQLDDIEEDPVSALARKMTEHGIPRCEHGALNRCRLCGVERARDFEPGQEGADWRIAWRPIAKEAA